MRHSTPDYTLWLKPESWPYDIPDHVFIARACEKLGKKTFADEWKGVGDSAARKKVLELIREHCAYGRLTAVAMAYRNKLVRLMPERWYSTDCWEWFPTCTITNFAVYGSGVHPLAGVSHFPLYLTDESLSRLFADGSPLAAVVGGPDTIATPDQQRVDESNLTKREVALEAAFVAVFADGAWPAIAADRDKKIRQYYESKGETVPTARSIQRYLAKMRQ